MFLVFGTFTMAAGVLLSLTIIMLLADVRRTELAAVRLGLRRSDARALFVYEGAPRLVSRGFGSVLGLGLRVISVGFSTIFSVGALNSFSWTLDSSGGLDMGAPWRWSCCGQAQYSTPTKHRSCAPGTPHAEAWCALGCFLAASHRLRTDRFVYAWLASFRSRWRLVACLLHPLGRLILLLTPLFTWQLPVLLNRNQLKSLDTLCCSQHLGAIGVLFWLWTLALALIDPLRQKMDPNELAFIVLGLLQVFAGVLVLTSIAPQAVAWLAKRSWITCRTGPVGSVALAHPLAHPVRTAVVMGMFSITMLSVVVLAGYTEQFDSYSSDFVEEAEGEFELLLTSTRSRPIDYPPIHWLTTTHHEQHHAVRRLSPAGSPEDVEGERMPYILRAWMWSIQHGGLPLHAWDTSLGNTSDEAWNSISKPENIVFLDASFGLNPRRMEPP